MKVMRGQVGVQDHDYTILHFSSSHHASKIVSEKETFPERSCVKKFEVVVGGKEM